MQDAFEPLVFNLKMINDVPEMFENLIDIDVKGARLASNHENYDDILADAVAVVQFLEMPILSSLCTSENLAENVDLAIAPLAHLLPERENLKVNCAAVCVYPVKLHQCLEYMSTNYPNATIKTTSVTSGFPHSQIRREVIFRDLKAIITLQPDEVDIVANRSHAAAGKWNDMYLELLEVKTLLPPKMRMKTIFLCDDIVSLSNIYKCCIVAMLAGTDFLCIWSGDENKSIQYRHFYAVCTAIYEFYNSTNRRVGLKIYGKIDIANEGPVFMHMTKKLLGMDWMSPNYFRIASTDSLPGTIKQLNKLRLSQ